MRSFDLHESDFAADAPCLVEGPKTITIGGQDRSLDALDADIVPRTQDGRLVVDGTVSAETALYDFKASFKVTYEMGLDDIPRDPKGEENWPVDVQSVESLEQALSVAGDKKRAGSLSDQDYEAQVKLVSERFDALPRTVGVRPAQNPPEPEVNPDFSLTVAGKAAAAAGAAAIVGLLALPVTWAAGAAGVGAAGAGGLLTLAIVQYITTVLTIDWFGTGIGSRQVKKSLNDHPEGTSLPPVGIPVDVDLNRQRLAVYFRPLPAKLWVSCITAEEAEGQESDGNIRLIGGRWPTDGQSWKLSNDDAILFVDSEEMQLVVEPDSAGGNELPIGVATAEDGRRNLRVAGTDPDRLHRLPQCSPRAGRSEDGDDRS
jgi:hypothetical protein